MSIAEDYGYDGFPERLTRKQLVACIRNHSASLDDFDAEHPISDSYDGDSVLAWLGY